MNTVKNLFVIFLFTLIISSCNKKEHIDEDKPSIDLSIKGAFPVNCDTLYFGETFHFKALFTDNAELGTYSIDIHNNFDHHAHSTEAGVENCHLSPNKDAVHPFAFTKDYSIPSGSSKYETDLSLTFPSSDGNNPYEEGDYHFFISLTDKTGWSAQKGLSIKILHRNK